VLDGKNYYFESELGEGGFGTVYKCRDPYGTVVAIKKIAAS
jgi:serine/threonine protein kinase